MLRRPRATKDNDGGAAVSGSTPSGDVAVTVAAPMPETVLQGAGVGGGQAGLQLSPSGVAPVPAIAGGGTALAVAAGLEPGLAAPVPAADGVLEHNGIVVDSRSRTVIRSGRELDLTRSEFDLLYALMESGRVVRTKADLVRRLRNEPYNTGGYISDSDERTIEVHMANLRRKLGDDTKAPRWIKTVRGVGYSLAPKR